MLLDLENLTLSFKVNNIDYGILSKIDKTKYKAAVEMYLKDRSIEFVSYNVL